MDKPTGNVTFLFTDIEGSTKLSQEFAENYPDALIRHNMILRDAVNSNNGFVFKTVGDAFCCAFQNAADAVRAAYEIQKSLLSENWNEVLIKVRIGIHSGISEWNGEDYTGYITLARAARVMSSVYGEQIIISNSTYVLCKHEFSADEENIFTFRDLGERRLKDVIQPIRLFQVTAPGIREEFPPLKTLDARPNNLPAQLTNFIGREEEIKKIKELLKDSRLVTLLGTGGAGKTRLTIQIAADLIDDFANGVWFIELAPLSNPDFLAQTIANVFNLQNSPNQVIEEALINYLSEKEILLIFDNCEHLIEACSVLIEKILINSPGLKILTSSREVLRSSGEKIHQVLPLKHPEPNDKITSLQLSQFEAVRLFIERALVVNHDFRVSNDNAPALAQICFRLDGIPLAIELAAARIKILTVEKINERLENRFSLLTTGKRTDAPRQQTLRALIDWSYDLLSDKEKTLFTKLSVFSGGWTLEAAEEICPDKNIKKYEVLDLMTSLFEKSLINSTEISGIRRFNLLESLKEYGSEKLIDRYNIFKKHFEFYSGIASEEEMAFKGFDEIEWVKAAEKEKENIREAVNWAIENETEKAYKIVSDTSYLYRITGLALEGNLNCRKILNKNKFADEYSKALIQDINSGLLYDLGRITESFKLSTQSLSVFRRLNMKKQLVDCLNNLGNIAHINNDFEKKKLYNEEAFAISRENDFKKELLTSLYNLSFCFPDTENLELRKKYREDALKISREINNTTMTITILASLGKFETDFGIIEKAKLYTNESLLLAKQMNNQKFISINLSNLGNIYLKEKDFENAEYYLNESIGISKEYGLINSYPLYKDLAALFIKKGDFEKALLNYRESLRYGLKFGSNFFTKNILRGIGLSYKNSRKPDLSLKVFIILKALYPETEIYENEKDYNQNIRIEDLNSNILQLRELLGDAIYEKYLEEAENIKAEEIEKFVLENFFDNK